MPRKSLYDFILRASGGPLLRALWRPWRRSTAVVLTYHRFATERSGDRGFSLDELRQQLNLLRRRRYSVVPLVELLERLAAGDACDHCLSITIDDGYDDFFEAASVFDEFGCPTTTFLTTGFIDRTTWMWWDRVESALLQSRRANLQLHLPHTTRELLLGERDARIRLAIECFELLKQVSTTEKWAAIQDLEAQAEVEVSSIPTSRYSALSWDEVRQLEARGHRFGPHTVTHPILSRCESVASAREILQSWERLCAEVSAPQSVFCYPNGTRADFGRREMEMLTASGIKWATTTEYEYVNDRPQLDRYRIPRFAAPESVVGLDQLITGFEGFKRAIRSRRVGGWAAG